VCVPVCYFVFLLCVCVCGVVVLVLAATAQHRASEVREKCDVWLSLVDFVLFALVGSGAVSRRNI
jgi:hypothetical protein